MTNSIHLISTEELFEFEKIIIRNSILFKKSKTEILSTEQTFELYCWHFFQYI